MRSNPSKAINGVARLALFSLFGMMALGGAACGSPSSHSAADSSAPVDAQELANQHARFTKMIDQRRYEDVIRILERPSDPEAPGRLRFRGLLAMAHLGQSGFEPLRFAGRVLAPQSTADPALDQLVPGCNAKALSRLDSVSLPCLLKRVWSQLPDANDPDFARARSILREEYADLKKASMAQNTLAAIVESASALSRVSRILLRHQLRPTPTEEDLVFYVTEALAAADEARRVLERVPYASPKLSELLMGVENQFLFARVGLNPVWVRETGVPLLLELVGKTPADLTQVIPELLIQLAGILPRA